MYRWLTLTATCSYFVVQLPYRSGQLLRASVESFLKRCPKLVSKDWKMYSSGHGTGIETRNDTGIFFWTDGLWYLFLYQNFRRLVNIETVDAVHFFFNDRHKYCEKENVYYVIGILVLCHLLKMESMSQITCWERIVYGIFLSMFAKNTVLALSQCLKCRSGCLADKNWSWKALQYAKTQKYTYSRISANKQQLQSRSELWLYRFVWGFWI